MMIGDSSTTRTMEGLALHTHTSSQNQGNILKKGDCVNSARNLGIQKKHVEKYMGNLQIGSLIVQKIIKRVVLMLLQDQMTPTLLKPVLLPRNNLMHCINRLDIFLFLLKQLQ